MAAKLSEYHTGYRAFSRELLERLPLDANSDDFVFDNQMLAQIVWLRPSHRRGELPDEILPRGLLHQSAPQHPLRPRLRRHRLRLSPRPPGPAPFAPLPPPPLTPAHEKPYIIPLCFVMTWRNLSGSFFPLVV